MKTISVKLDDSVIFETDNICFDIGFSRNHYIT